MAFCPLVPCARAVFDSVMCRHRELQLFYVHTSPIRGAQEVVTTWLC